MHPMDLTLTIPNYDPHIEVVIKRLKETLVYLETPICRQMMTEEARRAEVKRVTELFRNAIHIRHVTGDPLYS